RFSPPDCLLPATGERYGAILGVMPLVISSGAGSGAQNAVGTGVMGGMVTATILAIFFVPVFFVVVRRRFSKKSEDIEHSHQVEHH
ncbi:efflux RND transporter permease subunit, partial [Klebsiella pneumoniae]